MPRIIFDGGNTFPGAPGAVVYLCEFGVHRVAIRYGNEKFKGCVAQSKSPGTHEHELTLLLLLAWLIEIIELRLYGKHDSFVRVRLVVEFKGVVSVGEVLLGLRLYLQFVAIQSRSLVRSRVYLA